MTNQCYDQARYRLAGDCGLLVEYGEGIAPDVNAKVRAMAAIVAGEAFDGVRECIPTYRSLLLVYDPAVTDPAALTARLEALESQWTAIDIPQPVTVEIPVCYGGDYGPDIETVAGSSGISVADVIRLHSETLYAIYMIGFTPGFPFLGGLPPALHTPRLKTPRTHVPMGSVGIANDQTGIYPVASPGGWQLIGRTPLRLFRPEAQMPFLYRTGDRIRFVPITPEHYAELADRERGA
ncbi:MAG: 5-oxoprolinase subunit PxpB [Pseudomonadota bacterium]